MGDASGLPPVPNVQLDPALAGIPPHPSFSDAPATPYMQFDPYGSGSDPSNPVDLNLHPGYSPDQPPPQPGYFDPTPPPIPQPHGGLVDQLTQDPRNKPPDPAPFPDTGDTHQRDQIEQARQQSIRERTAQTPPVQF